MSETDCLTQYKRQILGLARGGNQRRFLEDAFSRWYVDAEKTPESRGLFPRHNLVRAHDLEFGNSHRGLQFNVAHVMENSEQIHKRYVGLCHYENILPDTLPHGIATQAQLKRLEYLYSKAHMDPTGSSSTDSKFVRDRNRLLQLYKFVGVGNMHLSVPPIWEGVEMFGSPLNTHNDQYCSPFVIERKFGSLGSFFSYVPDHSGLYLCNPPFDEQLIDRMADRLVRLLDETKWDVEVLITIPIWDSESQRAAGLRDFGMEFRGFKTLKNYVGCRGHSMLDKVEYPYYNYYTRRKAPASATHLLLLGRGPHTIDEFRDQWVAYSKS